MGEAHDEVMTVRRLGGCHQLLLGCFQFSVKNVFAHGAVEEKSLLGDHADVGAKRFQGDPGEVLAVDQEAARGGLVERRQQVHEGGFARAGGADQRDHLSGPGLDRNSLQDGPL